MTLTVGSLFSGIGGIDLGLERAGMTVKWHSEIEPYACRVLKKHWPDVPNIGDITQVDWETVPYVDVIAGGYPCQPFSLAGRRNGENDPRHLWPYFQNAISRIRPRYALLENVRGHLSLGGLSVIGDLASIGYDAEWRIVSAASVGANHRRDRLIIVAYPNGRRSSNGRQCPALSCEGGSRGNDGAGSGSHLGQIGMEEPRETPGDVADSDGTRPQRSIGEVFETRNVRGITYGGGSWWETEPDVGRVANGVPNRVDRLRGLGNAVVPQVAEVVGRLIMEHAS